ncbi:hypothetical protein GCM10007877_32650 [Marinibactrum halimedae]|uniref:Uncharacterized protein n=1 Tax=Marinibactrum halimedae TaxID=1444977 RepID=A0AA37WQ20_9GAMM|nr:hypothetical protein GCM10007877_32650 [Marinibactrum halimedae]
MSSLKSNFLKSDPINNINDERLRAILICEMYNLRVKPLSQYNTKQYNTKVNSKVYTIKIQAYSKPMSLQV